MRWKVEISGDMKQKTQKQCVEEVLREEGEIDNFSVISGDAGFRCLRLGDIIFRLRREGWEIDTQLQPNKNTVYKLLSAPELPKQRKVVVRDGVAVEVTN